MAYRNLRVLDIRRKATSSVRFRRQASNRLSSAPANPPLAPPSISPYDAAAARHRARSKFNLGNSSPATESRPSDRQPHPQTASRARTDSSNSNAAGGGGLSGSVASTSGGGKTSGASFSFFFNDNDDEDEDDEDEDEDDDDDFDYDDDIINVPMARVLEQLDAERLRLKCIDRGMGALVENVLAARTRTSQVSSIIQRTLRRRGPSLNLTRIPVEISPQCRTMVPKLDILTINIPKHEEEPEEVVEDTRELALDFYEKHGETFQWRPAKRSTIFQRVNAVSVLTPSWFTPANPPPAAETQRRGSIGPRRVQLNMTAVRPGASPRELAPFKIGTPRGYTPRGSAAPPATEPLSPKPRRISARYCSQARGRRVSGAKPAAAAGPAVSTISNFRTGRKEMFGFGSSNGRVLRIRNNDFVPQKPKRNGGGGGGGGSGSGGDGCRSLSTQPAPIRKARTPARVCGRTPSRGTACGRGGSSVVSAAREEQTCTEIDRSGQRWSMVALVDANASADGGGGAITTASVAVAASRDLPGFASDDAEPPPQDSSSAVQYDTSLGFKISFNRSLSERLSSQFCGASSARAEDSGGGDVDADCTALLEGRPQEEVLKSINSMLTDIQATNTQLNPYIPSFIAGTLARASKVAPQPLAVALSSMTGLRPSLRWSTATSTKGRGSTAAAALSPQASNAWVEDVPPGAVGGGSDGGSGKYTADTASPEPCISRLLVHLAKELQPMHQHVMRTRTRRGSGSGVPPPAAVADTAAAGSGGGAATSHNPRFRRGPGRLSPSLLQHREQHQPPGSG
ncbi:hypothetical protein Vretimale_14455, partial [Volvox reticuliferus]